MKLFEVEIKTTVVVIAENSGDAEVKARRDMPSIQRDQYFESRVVKSLSGELLPPGWDGMCIPYGDYDGKTIKEICA